MAALVYIDPAELAAKLGNVQDTPGLARAAILGTRWVAARVDADLADMDDELDGSDWSVTLTPCRPQWAQAALIAAVRFYRAPDAPFGVLGGLGDTAVSIKSYIPEADLVLYGQVKVQGFA